MPTNLKRPPQCQTTGTGQHPSQKILARLERVRETGAGCWLASCPGPLHKDGDKHPSLSIRTAGDTVLLKCFAGCDVLSILSAIGLKLHDLFPDNKKHIRALPPMLRKREGQAAQSLRALKHEAMILLVAAGRLMNGETLSLEDFDSLRHAYERIEDAVELLP